MWRTGFNMLQFLKMETTLWKMSTDIGIHLQLAILRIKTKRVASGLAAMGNREKGIGLDRASTICSNECGISGISELRYSRQTKEHQLIFMDHFGCVCECWVGSSAFTPHPIPNWCPWESMRSRRSPEGVRLSPGTGASELVSDWSPIGDWCIYHIIIYHIVIYHIVIYHIVIYINCIYINYR